MIHLKSQVDQNFKFESFGGFVPEFSLGTTEVSVGGGSESDTIRVENASESSNESRGFFSTNQSEAWNESPQNVAAAPEYISNQIELVSEGQQLIVPPPLLLKPIDIKSLSQHASYQLVADYNIYDGTLSSVPTGAGFGDHPLQFSQTLQQEIKTEPTTDESHVQTPPQNFKSTGEGGDQGGQYEEDLDFVEEPLEDDDITCEPETMIVVVDEDETYIKCSLNVGAGVQGEDIKEWYEQIVQAPTSIQELNSNLNLHTLGRPRPSFQLPPLPPMSTILPQNQNNFQQQHLNIFKQDFNSENSLSPPQNDFSSRPTFMTGSPTTVVNSIRNPLPREAVLSENSPYQESQFPRDVLECLSNNNVPPSPSWAQQVPSTSQENSHPVFLDQKENFNFDQPTTFQINPNPLQNGLQITSKIKQEKRVAKFSPYKKQGKAKGIGAIGQEFYGKDAENKQVCALCPFVATTKNPYRHLQDHFARIHFKTRLADELPKTKPFKCPFPNCETKPHSDWQAVMRHYIGNNHGILEKWIREEMVKRADPGTVRL